MNGPRRWRDAAALALLAAAAAALLWRPLFLGEVPVGADHLQFQYPWGLEAPENPKLRNINVSDGLQQFYTYRLRLYRSLKENRLPLWSGDSFCGTPFAGIDFSSLFYPFNAVAFRFVHPDRGLGWLAFLHTLLAGSGGYLFLRLSRAGRTGSLVGALSFMFAGFLVVWLEHPPMQQCPSWLPLLLALLEIAIRKRKFAHFCLFGAAWAAQITAGYVQGSVYLAATLSAWAVWRAVSEKSAAAVLGFAAAGLAAALLSSPHWVPVLQLAAAGHREAASGGGWRVDGFPPAQFIALLLPDFFGTPMRLNYHGAKNYTELTFYAGTGAAALFVLSFFAVKGGASRFFKWAAAISVLFAAGSPLYLPFYHTLPFFKLISAHRILAVGSFSVCMLAGMTWSALESGRRKVPRKTIAATAFGLALICLAAVPVSALFSEMPAAARLRLVQPDLVRAGSVLAAFLVLLTAFRPSRLRNAAAVAVVVLDLLPWALRYNPSFPPEKVFPPHPSISWLQKQPGPFRISAYGAEGWILYPNSPMVYGLQDLRGYDSLYLKRYQKLVGAVQERYSPLRFPRTNVLDFTVNRAPILDFMNFAYLMTAEPLSALDWEPVYSGGVYIYRNLRVMPRVNAVPYFKIFENDAAELEAVAGPDFDPRMTVYLEERPEDADFHGLDIDGPPSAPPLKAAARLERYEGDRYVVRGRLSRPGFIVVSESHFPGWKAWVDGKPAPLFRANYQFMAVPTAGGEHLIELAFRPDGVRTAMTAAAATLAAILSVLAAAAIPRRTKRAS